MSRKHESAASNALTGHSLECILLVFSVVALLIVVGIQDIDYPHTTYRYAL